MKQIRISTTDVKGKVKRLSRSIEPLRKLEVKISEMVCNYVFG